MRKLFIFISVACFLWSCNSSSNQSGVVIEETATELESIMSFAKAREVAEGLISPPQRVMAAYACEMENPVIVALLDENKDEYEDHKDGNMPFYFSLGPSYALLVLENKSGSWQISHHQKVDMNLFEKNGDDAFILHEVDPVCSVLSVAKHHYFYTHISRTVFGVATANILHDFVVFDLNNGKGFSIQYYDLVENVYTDNGEMEKYPPYPTGIEEYLSQKIDIHDFKSDRE